MDIIVNDCLIIICKFLNVKDLVSCSLINKQFYGISQNESIWNPLFLHKFSNVSCSKDHYNNYKTYDKLDRFLWKTKKMDVNNVVSLWGLNFYGIVLQQQLPTEIGKLTMLQTLNLRYTQIKKLPTEIGQLIMLDTLSISHNQLHELPSEIGELCMLKNLYISNNQLQELPTEIGNLTKLEKLHLRRNKLKQLPTEIEKLTELKRLFLYDNQLKDPIKIEKLVMLDTLYLDDSQVKLIPQNIDKRIISINNFK
jgi:hypothetical protein